MNVPLKELNDDYTVKQESSDDLSIIGVNPKDRKPPPPVIKCPKHEQEQVELICTLPECPFNRTFCKQCNLEEICKNNSQHFTSHKNNITNLSQFFKENFQNLLKCKENPEFREDLQSAFQIISNLKGTLLNEQAKKMVKMDISYLTNSAFGLQEQIENVNRGLYGRMIKKNIFSKEKQLKKRKSTKELEKELKKSKALTANYLNNFLNKSKDIGFLEKVDKVIEYMKNIQLKKMEEELIFIREEINEVEDGKKIEKRGFQESEEEKMIVKSLKKIKKEIKAYKMNAEANIDEPRNQMEEKNEEKPIKLEKNV